MPIGGLFKPLIGWAFVQHSMFDVRCWTFDVHRAPPLPLFPPVRIFLEQEQTEWVNWRDFQAGIGWEFVQLLMFNVGRSMFIPLLRFLCFLL